MAVLRGAAGWIVHQAAAMQTAAGVRRWRACPPRWWRGGCAAAVRSGKAGRLWALCRWGRAGAGAWSSCRRSAAGVVIWCGAGGADPSRCRWWAVRSAAAAVRRRGHRDNGCTTPSACRAADPAGRAGGRREGAAKEKGQGGGAWCAAALAFCLHWRCDLLRRVRPGAYRGRRGSAPRSGAGLPTLALIRAQRFQLATFQHGTACAGGAPSGAFLSRRRRGQILHFTG